MGVSGGNYTLPPHHPSSRAPNHTCTPSQTRTGSAMQSSSESNSAAAWAVLVEPAASLLAPLLGMEDLFGLSLVCKGFRPIWRQLCHMGALDSEWIVELLASGAYRAERG